MLKAPWVYLTYRPVQILLALLLYFLSTPYLPPASHQWLYTTSLFIKDLLIWMMPLTVGFFIAHSVCSFQRRAPLFILTLLLFEAASNLSSVWCAFAGGSLAAEFLPSIKLVAVQQDFSAIFRIPLSKPVWWSAEKGTIAGLAIGWLAAFTKQPLLVQSIQQGKEIVQWILTRIFSRLIPLFVLGFIARMVQTHLIHQLFAHYAVLLGWLVLLTTLYIALLFLLGAGSLPAALRAIKNLSPAAGIAFTSGCSLSTMPWTIAGTAKNLRNPELAKAVIPATTNIQQIGDCLTNTFLCFLIYRHFYGHNPEPFTWIQFSLVFVLARFATAAVIGGAIFLMIPLYESYLSFNAEMIALILAFNVILDPLITTANVVANGALCRLFEKLWGLVSPTPIPTEIE
jgi:Na+/H+-dicarboxylate symporter